MAEKQFTVHFDETLGNQIWRDNKPFACVDARHQANKICDLLNEQHGQIQSQSIVIQGYQERCDKVFKENVQLKQENQGWVKTASRMDTIHHEDRRYCERMYRENEKLKQENQQYKSLLRDMGLLMSW